MAPKKKRTMIKVARVTNIDNDQKSLPQAQYEFLGKVKDVVNVYPYGMTANAPLENLGIVIEVLEDETNEIAIPLSEESRSRGLKEGEVAFGNWVTKSTIFFKENGDIEITANGNLTANVTGNAEITAANAIINAITNINGNTTINGNLQVNGNITLTGNLQAASGAFSGAISSATGTIGGIPFGSHVHPIVSGSSAPGPTGGPQ